MWSRRLVAVGRPALAFVRPLRAPPDVPGNGTSHINVATPARAWATARSVNVTGRLSDGAAFMDQLSHVSASVVDGELMLFATLVGPDLPVDGARLTAPVTEVLYFAGRSQRANARLPEGRRAGWITAGPTPSRSDSSAVDAALAMGPLMPLPEPGSPPCRCYARAMIGRAGASARLSGLTSFADAYVLLGRAAPGCASAPTRPRTPPVPHRMLRRDPSIMRSRLRDTCVANGQFGRGTSTLATDVLTIDLA